jgi:hypothetical protein
MGECRNQCKRILTYDKIICFCFRDYELYVEPLPYHARCDIDADHQAFMGIEKKKKRYFPILIFSAV